MLTWIKGSQGQLSLHFSRREFECHCSYKDCTTQTIDAELIKKLETVHALMCKPILITSGYRCSKHQKDLSANPAIETANGTSQHELGKAADITWPKFDSLLTNKHIVETEFKATGWGKHFVHVDLRLDKERRWSYSY